MFPSDTIFTGFKKGHELSEIYASCDVFVCPSSTETFGNVVLEAMASGLPVIGANAGGVKEIITHRSNGLKFCARDSVDLINCMMEILKNANLREQLKVAARKYSETRTWNRVFDDLLHTYSLDSMNKIISA